MDRVVVERSTSGATRATGVLCTADSGACIEVTARRAVVLASGALHTPCVLLRSGLGGPKVGRHLRLHPVTGVTARYDREMKLLATELTRRRYDREMKLLATELTRRRYDREMKLYEGTPTSAICDVAEVRRAQQQRRQRHGTQHGTAVAAASARQQQVCPAGSHYGAKIEVPCGHPGLMASAIGWCGGEQLVRDLSQLNRTGSAVVMQVAARLTYILTLTYLLTYSYLLTCLLVCAVGMQVVACT